MAKWRRGLFDQRGASLTEYVLVAFLLLMVGAVAFKALGNKGKEAVNESHKTFSGDSTEPTNHAIGSMGNGSHDKSGVAMKVSITNGASNAKAFASDVGHKVADEASQVELEFSFKKLARWLAIAIAALGIGVAFSVYKRGRAEVATAESEAPDVTGPAPNSMGPQSMPRIGPNSVGGPSKPPMKYTD